MTDEKQPAASTPQHSEPKKHAYERQIELEEEASYTGGGNPPGTSETAWEPASTPVEAPQPKVYWKGSELFCEQTLTSGTIIKCRARFRGASPFATWEVIDEQPSARRSQPDLLKEYRRSHDWCAGEERCHLCVEYDNRIFKENLDD